VRREPHRPVEGIFRAVMEGDADRQGHWLPGPDYQPVSATVPTGRRAKNVV
jgi:hypothetical protein